MDFMAALYHGESEWLSLSSGRILHFALLRILTLLGVDRETRKNLGYREVSLNYASIITEWKTMRLATISKYCTFDLSYRAIRKSHHRP